MKVVMRMVMAGLFLAACGGDDGGTADRTEIPIPDGGPDADPTLPDADMPGTPDAAPHVCLTEANYGDVTLGDQQAASGGGTVATDPDGITFMASMNADATPDLFRLELFKGYGVYTANITTGLVVMSGVELDYATCGMCPRIFTDFDPATMMTAEQQYYATGGSVTVTTITPNFTGSFSNLTYEEVTINPTTFESTPVPGGCNTAVMSGTFDIVNTYTP